MGRYFLFFALCPLALVQANNCVAGKFYNGTTCQACPHNQYQDQGSQTSCKNCTAGRYRDTDGDTVATQAQATELEASYNAAIAGSWGSYGSDGSYAPKYVTDSAAVACTACPAGQHQADGGKLHCDVCAAGKYQDQDGQSACIECESGRYQDQDGQSACIECESGRYQDQLGQTDCIGTMCSAGRFGILSATTPQPQANACQACDVGRYTGQPGQEVCKDCPGGKFSATVASTACIRCESGRFQDQLGQTDCKGIRCSAGTFGILSATTPQPNACQACDQGRYTDQAGQGVCKGCPGGKYSVMMNSTECTRCGIGQYQDQDGQSACIECESGRYQDQLGQTDCIGTMCSAGRFGILSATTPQPQANACQACDVGRYTGQPGEGVCKDCPGGKYSESMGEGVCKDCPGGRYDHRAGQTACGFECPGGFCWRKRDGSYALRENGEMEAAPQMLSQNADANPTSGNMLISWLEIPQDRINATVYDFSQQDRNNNGKSDIEYDVMYCKSAQRLGPNVADQPTCTPWSDAARDVVEASWRKISSASLGLCSRQGGCRQHVCRGKGDKWEDWDKSVCLHSNYNNDTAAAEANCKTVLSSECEWTKLADDTGRFLTENRIAPGNTKLTHSCSCAIPPSLGMKLVDGDELPRKVLDYVNKSDSRDWLNEDQYLAKPEILRNQYKRTERLPYYYYKVRARAGHAWEQVKHVSEWSPRSRGEIVGEPIAAAFTEEAGFTMRAQPITMEGQGNHSSTDKPKIDPGQSLQLRAVVRGRPRVRYEWYRDGERLTNETNKCKETVGSAAGGKVDPSNPDNEVGELITCTIEGLQDNGDYDGNYQLKINNIQDDSGNYDDADDVASSTIKVTMNQNRDMVINNPPPLPVIPGSGIHTTCEVAASPGAQMFWFRVDSAVDPCAVVIEKARAFLNARDADEASGKISWYNTTTAYQYASDVLATCAQKIVAQAEPLPDGSSPPEFVLKFDDIKLGSKPFLPSSATQTMTPETLLAPVAMNQQFYCMANNSAGIQISASVPLSIKECEPGQFPDHEGFCKWCPLASAENKYVDASGIATYNTTMPCKCNDGYFAVEVPKTKEDGRCVRVPKEADASLPLTYCTASDEEKIPVGRPYDAPHPAPRTIGGVALINNRAACSELRRAECVWEVTTTNELCANDQGGEQSNDKFDGAPNPNYIYEGTGFRITGSGGYSGSVTTKKTKTVCQLSGIVCVRCPFDGSTGLPIMNCPNNANVTTMFDDVTTTNGFWQDKSFYRRCDPNVKGTLNNGTLLDKPAYSPYARVSEHATEYELIPDPDADFDPLDEGKTQQGYIKRKKIVPCNAVDVSVRKRALRYTKCKDPLMCKPTTGCTANCLCEPRPNCTHKSCWNFTQPINQTTEQTIETCKPVFDKLGNFLTPGSVATAGEPMFNKAGPSGCRVGHTGPMCMLCADNWEYSVGGFCLECTGEKPSTDQIRNTVIAGLLAIIVFAAFVVWCLKPYNVPALVTVFKLDKEEAQQYFDMKHKDRSMFLRDIRRAQVMDEVNFGVKTRRIMALLPDHGERLTFLSKNSQERYAEGERIFADWASRQGSTSAGALGDMFGGVGSGLGNVFGGIHGRAASIGSNVVSGRVGGFFRRRSSTRTNDQEGGSTVTDSAADMASEAAVSSAAAQREREAAEAERDGNRPTGETSETDAQRRERESAEAAHESNRPAGETAAERREREAAQAAHGSEGRQGGDDPQAPADAGAEPAAPEPAADSAGGSMGGEIGLGDRGGFSGILEQSKITLSLMQVTSQWKLNFDFQWPADFTKFTKYLQVFNFNFLDMHAVACATRPVYMDKFLAMSFFPIFLAGVLFTLNRLCRLTGKMSGTFGSTSFTLKIMFVILFVMFPQISNTTFKVLDCDTLADGSRWMKAQYSVSCSPDFPLSTWLFGDTMAYGSYKALAIIMIAIYPIGVPAMLATVLFLKRDKLFEKLDPNAPVIRDSDGDIVRTPHHETSKYLGSLYVAYSSKFYMWEVLELIRKVLLTGVIIFIQPETASQLAFGCLIAMTFTVLYSEYKPYLYGEDDVLQLMCQLAIFCTMFSGLLIKARVDEKDNFNPTLFAAVLVVLNAVPVTVGVVRIALLVRKVIKQIFQKKHIIAELSKKGAIKSVLKTPKFPKIDNETLQEVDKKKKKHSKAGRLQRWFGLKKTTKKPQITRMGDLLSRLEEVDEEDAAEGAPRGITKLSNLEAELDIVDKTQATRGFAAVQSPTFRAATTSGAGSQAIVAQASTKQYPSTEV